MTATDDGSKVYTIDTGYSPASMGAWTVDYSEMAGGSLFATATTTPWDVGNSANGRTSRQPATAARCTRRRATRMRVSR